MITLTFQSLISFLILFFILTLIFSMMYKAMEVNVDSFDPFDENADATIRPSVPSRRTATPHYPGVTPTFAMILYSFRNAMGDFTSPNYDYWLNPAEKGS